jgi:hypothetical protein
MVVAGRVVVAGLRMVAATHRRVMQYKLID